MASDVTVTVRCKDLNLNLLEHDWEINPRLYEGIRNVDYSGMTDLVEVIDRKISDDRIGHASSQNGGEPGGPHTSRRTSQNSVKAKFGTAPVQQARIGGHRDYARSCKRTSENVSSTHSGEYRNRSSLRKIPVSRRAR